jgi:signal peptidase I
MTQNDAPSAPSRSRRAPLSAASLDALSDGASPEVDAATTDAGDSGARDGRPSRGKSAWRFFRDILLILLAAIVISFLIKTFLIRSFYIPSASM